MPVHMGVAYSYITLLHVSCISLHGDDFHFEHVEAAASLFPTQGMEACKWASHRIADTASRTQQFTSRSATPPLATRASKTRIFMGTDFSPLTINCLWHLDSPPPFACLRLTGS